MTRFFPQSLFGQTLLILLAGLVVSHAAGSWIYTADREQAVRAVGGASASRSPPRLPRFLLQIATQRSPRRSKASLLTGCRSGLAANLACGHR